MSSIVRIAAYSSDPPGCDTFHSFDPDSYVIISAINDSLVYIDTEGRIQPSLAISWNRVDALTVDFQLRQGVTFHNGEPFDADSVVATIQAHRDPANHSFTGQATLASIAKCEKLDRFSVRMTYAHPDGMFLHRLHCFSAIYPAGILKEHGPAYFLHHPVGTGAYAFHEWRRGEEIVLRRNPDHWAGQATVDELRFPIIKKRDWLDLLQKDQIEIAINIDPHDAWRATYMPGVHVGKRAAAMSHFFLLRHQGPLADERVRRALNMAVHKPLLCKIADHGFAAPQTAIQTPGQVGYSPDLAPIPYDPLQAAQLIAEAGYPNGFKLTGLVSESSNSVYQMVREFLERVGVQLKAEVLPSGEWMKRVVVAKLTEQDVFQGDFVVTNMDNPCLHGAFHHFILLFSQGPFSQLDDPDYDQRFLQMATTVDPEALEQQLRELDAYVQQRSLFLFTTRHYAYYAACAGCSIPISLSGHFNYANLWGLRRDDDARENRPLERPPTVADADIARLIEATSYPGSLFLSEDSRFERADIGQLWSNAALNETRWRIIQDEMIRSLIDQVDAQTWLANIDRSTKDLAILVSNHDGRVVFHNEGSRRLLGTRMFDGEHPLKHAARDDSNAPYWDRITTAVARNGIWSGVLTIARERSRRVFLTATPALNELDAPSGMVCVFWDHAKEEERLRMKEEAKTAALVQKALFPRVNVPDFDVASYYLPASETGGDWYSVHDGKQYLTLMIGDVTGHGTPAAFVTASVAGAVSVLNIEGDTISRIMAELNRVVCLTGFGDYLMSFYLMRIDKSSLEFQYCCAGHQSPILLHQGSARTLRTHEVGGDLLGYRQHGSSWIQATGQLDRNTLIFLYTDGVSEGQNPDGIGFGFRGLMRFFRRISTTDSCQQVLDRLVATARKHYAGQPLVDDLTMLLARV